MTVHRGRLYVGFGGRPRNLASVWELQPDGSWAAVAGFGLNGSWRSDGAEGTASGDKSLYELVYRLHSDGQTLYAGLAGYAGSAAVWAAH